MFRPPVAVRLLAAASLVAVAACSDSTSPSAANRSATLTFSTRGDASTAGSGGSGATQTAAGTVVANGSDTLLITGVQLVIDEIELARGETGTCTSDDDDVAEITEGCAELEVGATLVDLPVTTSGASPLSVQLPAGTYHALEMKLRPARSGDDRAFLAAHPDLAGLSVIVTGSYKGQPFTWKGDVEAGLELAFSPPMVIDATGNFVVNIDIGRWFRTGTGAIIDPSTAAAGQQNFGVVAQNIRASFGVFEDDDHDGHDDHGSDD